MNGFKFDMGLQARDQITGFEGIITARYEYLNGCRRYELERLSTNGKPDGFVFDEDRLEWVDAPTPVVEPSHTGGPRDAPPRTGTR